MSGISKWIEANKTKVWLVVSGLVAGLVLSGLVGCIAPGTVAEEVGSVVGDVETIIEGGHDHNKKNK